MPALYYTYLYGHQRVVRGATGRLHKPLYAPLTDPYSFEFIGPPSPDTLQQRAVREWIDEMREVNRDYE